MSERHVLGFEPFGGPVYCDEKIAHLEAENARLRNALKEIADGEIYPQEVARAALYA